MPRGSPGSRKALREQLGWEYIAEQNFMYLPDKNAQFTIRSQNRFVAPTTVVPWGDVNAALAQVGVPPTSYLNYVNHSTSLYSKKAFKYGVHGFWAQIPPATDTSFVDIHLGLEPTGGLVGGLLAFYFWLGGGVVNTGLYAVSINNAGILPPASANVTALMPVDPSTALTRFLIKVNKANAEFWVNSTLIGIIQFASNSDTYNVSTGPPYYLHQIKGHLPHISPTLLEWNCKNPGDIGTRSNIRLHGMYCLEGDPTPPRNLQPYTGGVAWKGIVSNPSTTSDGIPIAGYKHKTVYFIADEAGTLNISIDYGDNAYDSITPVPLVVVANQLLTYPTENDGLWMKLIFTPTAPPATITRARVMMSD